MKSLISFLLLFLSYLPANAQSDKGTITGKIIDAATQKPVEYATLTVIDRQSKKVVTGSVSDAKGAFKTENIPNGTYNAVINFIGYRPYTIDSISINESQQSISLQTISIQQSAKALEGVTVSAKSPIIENRIDKIVYNAANDITSQGGAAVDVLKKVPQVTVDVDGNVELQGNANIRFLINGKPSSLFGNSVADALASIPASQIKSIEAITSPGAKYDAQGTGGIINIILKDNKVQGINGSINLSAGTRLENGSINLNIRHNNFGINAFFSGNAQLTSNTPYSQDRISTDTGAKTTARLLQDGYADFDRNGYQSGIGFDWNLTKKDNITGGIFYNHFANNSIGFINQEEITKDNYNTPIADISGIRNSESRFHISSLDWNLNYKKKLGKDGQELDIQCNASYGSPNSSFTQKQMYKGSIIPYVGSASSNPGTDRENNISIDYSHPVNDHFLLETGIKTILQDISSSTEASSYNPAGDNYVANATQSYRLKYGLKVYGGYLSTTFSIGDLLNVKAGARYEYTNVSIDYPNVTVPSYGSFVPSLILSHKFKKDQTLKLAYSNRIERPEYGELNPFVNLSDPYNLTTGNPMLKPEIGNNIELGYNKTFSGGANLYIGLIERINSHDIKPVTTFYPAYTIGDSVYNNVSVSDRQNIGVEYNSGITAYGSLPIKNKLNLRGNLSVWQRYIVSDLSAGNVSTGLSARLNLNVTYQLPRDLVIEAFGNYRSAGGNVQGRMPQSLTYTFAFRKLFWNKNASFGFTATNPFNRYIRQESTITTDNYIATTVRNVPYQSFGISLSYKFGKLEFKKSKEDENTYLNNPPGEGG